MALTTKQKQALLIGGTVLTVLLIVGAAEAHESGDLQKLLPFLEKEAPVRPVLPAPGEPVTTPVVIGETIAKAAPTIVKCDPWMLGPYEEGLGCFEIDGEWLLMPYNLLPAPTPGEDAEVVPADKDYDSEIPSIGNAEIGVSNNYSAYKIGRFWEISTLHPFLEEERKNGRLAVMNHGGTLSDVLCNDPASYINNLLGSEHAGGASMTALYIIATGGVGMAAMGASGASIAAGTRLSSIISGMAATLGTGTTFTIFGQTITASVFQALVAESLFSATLETYEMWGADEELRITALEAFQKFRYTHFAKRGDQGEEKLTDLPWQDFPAMGDLQRDILYAIGRYQRRTFE